MKKISILYILCFSLNMFCQTAEEKEVKSTIEAFFVGFHNRDSLAMKQNASKDVILQSIGKNEEGFTKIKNERFSLFLESIVSIPESVSFEEKLLDYNIQIDDPMAHVWTTYEFWIDGKFSHCGVNSFQLVKIDKVWKINYLIDTRRRAGCFD